jgi:hypothetical protein
MSMQSVLGVVGGVVGSFFGYPQLGFMVGSLVGGLLTPKEKTEGPRLDDLKVQVSTYGSGIPILYGTERIGGNVIWSTDKIETSTTEEAGKGGGAEHKSYRYFVHMRIALCETPRDGSTVSIVQIFQDGKLKWDTRSEIAIESALASEENLFAFFTLYQGHADQLPDPVEEIYSGGAGSVPAYRGVVSISMKAIECPGGRVPQFSFVLSSGATVGPVVEQQIDSDPTSDKTGAIITADGVWEYTISASFSIFNLDTLYGTTGSMQPVSTLSYPTGGTSPYPVPGALTPQVIVSYANGDLHLIDLQDRTNVLLYESGIGGPGTLYGRAAYDPSVDLFVISSWDEGTTGNEPWIVSRGGVAIECDAIAGDGHGGVVGFFEGVVHVVTSDGANLIYSRRSSDGTASIAMPDTAGPAAAFEPRWSALHVNANGVYLYAVLNGESTGFIYKITPAVAGGDPGGFTLLCDATGPSTENITNTISVSFYCTDEIATIGPILSGGPTGYNAVRFNAVTTNEALVSEIISDQCERAGETRYDVSAIPAGDTIHGYKIQNPASARNNIDPLLTAFAIYAVDEDGLIKFKKYEDIASEATITYDELGQADDGSESADAMPLNRAQEIDLPRSVSVSYVEETFDYQTATEKEARQVTEANEDLMIELPMATNSDHAKKVAQMILFARWRAQNTRSLKVSRKYAFLSPGDGITVEYPRGTSRLWRVMSLTDTGALIEMTVEPGDAEIYTQTAIGATGYVRQEVDALPSLQRLELGDMPILQDADNNAGIYAFMEPFTGTASGAELFIGDDDASLQTRGTVDGAAVIGFTEGALGDFSMNIMDERNPLIVSIGEGSLSSTTRATLYTSNTNAAAIGANGRWEIVQFLRASSLGGGRYLLSGLLRGRRGTERNRGNHEVGETFILLGTAGTLRPSMDVGAIGSTKSYRAISKGRSFNSAASQRYANTGEGLKPLSPWDLRWSIAANNDITLTWKRRTRLSSNALRGTVPLGESAESYSIDLYTSGAYSTLAGTLTSSTSSLLITSAEQSALGLTPGATPHPRIFQVSDSVGRGAVLQGS